MKALPLSEEFREFCKGKSCHQCPFNDETYTIRECERLFKKMKNGEIIFEEKSDKEFKEYCKGKVCDLCPLNKYTTVYDDCERLFKSADKNGNISIMININDEVK